MSRVLLINPRDNFTIDNDILPRLGLTLMGTILKKRGHEVKTVYMVADRILEEEQVKQLLRDFRPDVVGITLITYQTRWAKVISRLVREYNSNIRVVVGGPHPSALRGDMFDTFHNINIVNYGEGEESFIELVERKDIHNIKGIIYRDTPNTLLDTGPRPLLEDLDSLPFPDWSLVNLKRFSGPFPVKKSPVMMIMGSRGCPNSCTFCFKAVYGNRVRFHSPDYLVEQVKYLYKDFGAREVYFLDDTFNLRRDWLEKVLEGLIKSGLNKKLAFRAGFRVDKELLDLSLLKHMKEAGFWSIFYGVESGSQYMLNRMKKNISIEEIKRAFSLTHKVGIRTECPFIIGLPGETEETIKASLKLYEEIKPSIVGFARAMPFPGTAFEKEVIKSGHLIEASFDEFSYNRTRVRTNSLTSDQLEFWERQCNKLTIRHLAVDCLKDPRYLTKTISAIGLKETAIRILRNIK